MEAGPVPVFPHRLVRPIGIVIAGSAGERVQTAAAILCQAAIFSDLCCTQKNDYPVTVGSGFSLSEVALSPEPILYTGSELPDAVVIASMNGLREVQGRGDLERLASGSIVIADESVAAELPGCRTLRLPLRRTLSRETAALGGVAALVGRTGILDKGALLQALEVIVGGEVVAFRQAVEMAWGLGA